MVINRIGSGACLCIRYSSGGFVRRFALACFSLAMFAGFTVRAADIHEAAKKGDLEKIKQILAAGKDAMNARDAPGYTPLHWALIRAQWKAAGYLLDAGAGTAITGEDGATMLHCAANHDYPDIVKKLIAKGVPLNQPNIWGNTPLALTVQRGCAATARLLVESGAGLQAVTPEGWTPLHLAYRSGQPAVQQLLIRLGADQDALDRQGKRPADLAFVRPLPRPVPRRRYDEYTGEYETAGGFRVKVFIREDKLMLEDYAQDEIYPIAADVFYDRHEPWRIRFYRDPAGHVDKIVLDFQTISVTGRKIGSGSFPGKLPRLGVALKPLEAGELTEAELRFLFFDCQVNGQAQRVIRTGEGTMAEKAGIQAGDIILELNNEPLREPGDLQRLMLDLKPGGQVPVKLVRQGRVHYLIVVWNE